MVRFLTWLSPLVAVSLFLSCGSSNGTDNSEDNGDGDSSSFGGYTFNEPSVAVSYSLMGVPDDGTARAGADPASMITLTGQVRLIFTGADGVMKSALSTDGLSFTVDDNFTSPFPLVGMGEQTIVATPTGGYRMFVRSETQVFSATSDDGATWTQEAGVRFDVSSMGLTSTTGPSVVELSDGQYRMYFSPEPTNCAQPDVSNSIYSAISSDQVTWTADEGVRLGDDIDNRCKNKPSVLVESDGAVTLFYHVYSRTGGGDPYIGMVYYSHSTSADGLAFTSETSTGLGVASPSSGGLTQASDPNILEMADGTVRLYFDVLYAPNGDQIYVSSGVRN